MQLKKSVVVASVALAVTAGVGASYVTITSNTHSPYWSDMATCRMFLQGQVSQAIQLAPHADTYLRVDVGLLSQALTSGNRTSIATDRDYVTMDCTTDE
jgi:hypothetical protein